MKKTSNVNNRMNKSAPRPRRRDRRNVVPIPGPQQSEARYLPRRPRSRLTGAGKAWLRDYLNPCGEVERADVGIPDGSSSLAAIKNCRGDDVIRCPEALAAAIDKETPNGGNWWLCIFVPPWVDDTAVLIASAFEPTFGSQFTAEVAGAPAYPSWSQTGSSDTPIESLFLSRISTPGISTAIGTGTDGNVVNYASQYRMIKRGITCHLIADDLTNRGSVTAGQWFTKPQPEVIALGRADDSNYHTLTKVDFAWSLLIGNITPTLLTSTDERTYQGQAKDGVYMPIYKSGCDFSYQPYSQRKTVLHTLTDDSRNVETDDTYTDEKLDQFPSKVIDHTQNVGVVWFRGISSRANVRVKSRYSIQAVIQPGSPWGADSAIGPQRDQVAMDIAQQIQNDLPQAYPAHYNDWGLLGNIVKNLVSKIPVLGNFLTHLVEPVGRGVGEGIKSWWNN